MALGKASRNTSVAMLVRNVRTMFCSKKSTMREGSSIGLRLASLPESTQWTLLTGTSHGHSKSSKLGRLPSDIRRKCLAVYVGKQGTRYVINTKFLSHPLFGELLRRSQDEVGFEYEGGLNITCDSSLFEQVVLMIATKDPAASTIKLDELTNILATSMNN
ncbi:hypothetical protein R1flu_003047 [Riccia fluitans]|uniref:Small auxin up regulated protein n=1 Tax=Riccia fluitans TaxID=41844 RepID=A0ABD1Y7V0_9MARC